MIVCYIDYHDFIQPGKPFRNAAAFLHQGRIKHKVWKGIGLPPYSGSQYDFEHKYTVIARLFERIQKYHRRGVKITNAPDGALDWDIVNLSPSYDSDMCMDDFG